MGRNGASTISPEQAQPALGGEVRDDVGHDLAPAHLDLGGRAVVRLEVGQDAGRLGRLAVHLPRRRAVGQGDDAVVRVGRVVEEDRTAGDVRQAGRRTGMTTKSDSQKAR